MRLPSVHQLYDWGIGASVVCSFAANLLPNAKFLDDYPRTQKAYGTVVNGIAMLAINIRHCLPSLDIAAPVLGITKLIPIPPADPKPPTP
jgi:hypothetical protein